MTKTTYYISKMDCPSEENLIRMKLDGLPIQKLVFDIPNRRLSVIHSGDTEKITTALNELNLGSFIENSIEANEIDQQADHSNERKLLWAVLWINLIFFIVEALTGFVSNSMGLMADSLDMLADTIVYALSLYAVGHAIEKKKRVAKISGYFQMFLAVLGLAEVIRRFLGYEETPGFAYMIIVSIFALIGNATCLNLLQRSKSKEAHMQASMIFTSNDVIVNLGVILAGALVYLTNSKYPDLIVGCVVFLLVGRGAIRIMKLAK